MEFIDGLKNGKNYNIFENLKQGFWNPLKILKELEK
jgi:hypothetical protein